MKSRKRFIAGLLATVAFSLSLVTGVQASMCAVDVESAGHMMAEAAEPMALGESTHSVPGSSDQDCMGHHASDDDAPYCPFGAFTMGSACTTAASLPASMGELASSPEEALNLVAVGRRPHLLLGTSLFHPPKS